MNTSTREQHDVPDVPFLLGARASDNLTHAVARDSVSPVILAEARQALGGSTIRANLRTYAVCRADVLVAFKWGEFRRGTEWTDRRAGQLCPQCAWAVALHHNTTNTELTTLDTAEPERAALERLLPDPDLTTRICKCILHDRQQAGDYEPNHPRWAELLGHATAHRPVVLLPEDCAEDACDHHADDGGEAGCFAATNAVACPTCSLQAGPRAGEWQGAYQVIVPAPCSVLTAMADHNDTGLNSSPEVS